MKNGIYIIATPIGNLGDISARALEILSAADIIACEDTRMAKKLFSLLGLGLNKTFIKLEDHTENEQAEKIISLAKEGKVIAQISDAGSPLISDPGYKLVRRCKEEGVYVSAVPGACALICALQLSALPTNSFMFAGFIPNKDKARKDFLTRFKNLDTTLVFYETAARIKKTLTTAAEIFSSRDMAVARELTKIYEECINGSAEDLLAHFEQNEPKGEMVFMIGPCKDVPEPEINLEKILKEKLATLSVKDAAKQVAQEYNLNKNIVYKTALEIKNGL